MLTIVFGGPGSQHEPTVSKKKLDEPPVHLHEWNRENAIFMMANELGTKFYLNHWIWNWSKKYASEMF
jgi:fructosamine-3-kinase